MRMHLLVGIILIGFCAALPPSDAPIRYELYSNLFPSELTAANALGYTESSWNTFTNPIELEAYSTIQARAPELVVQIVVLGMDEGEWDCWVNGYLDYDWSDLATVGIQQNLVTLGWTEDSWNGVDIPPASENLFFAELDSDEQAAAEAICFFQERWDGLPLTDYAEDPRTKPVGCFAATNTVVTQNKGTIAISQLEIGDYVQDSYSTYSRVYSLSHVDRTAKAEIVSIELDNGENNPLELTADHMVYANGVRPVRAQDVVVGDILGQNSRVVKISKVQREGVYAPLTESGSIVVSGVASSCYMAMVDGFSPYFQHLVAQAATAPLRMTCTMNFSICQHETYTAGRSNFFWKIIQVVERFGGLPVLCQLAVAVLVAAPLGSLCLLELCMEWQIVRCSALVAVMVWLLRKSHQQQALREGNKKAL